MPFNDGDDDMAYPAVNGASSDLIASHEVRIRRVEGIITESAAIGAQNGAKLDSLAETLEAVKAGVDTFGSALQTHKDEDAKVHLRVHDLEEKQKSKLTLGKNMSYAFWTAMAAIAADLILHALEHFSH
jgi:hypothetical protein